MLWVSSQRHWCKEPVRSLYIPPTKLKQAMNNKPRLFTVVVQVNAECLIRTISQPKTICARQWSVVNRLDEQVEQFLSDEVWFRRQEQVVSDPLDRLLDAALHQPPERLWW